MIIYVIMDTNYLKWNYAIFIKEYIFAIHSMGICEGKEDLIDTVYESLSEMYEED